MLVYLRRYILKDDVLLLCFPNIVTVDHLSNPCESSPLVMMAEEILPSAMMAVPPGL